MKFDGQSITYDGAGNPTSYYNGTRWTFGWSNGRSLTSASGGGKTLSFTYDLQDGTRATKTVDGVVHNYIYAGGKLLRETYGSTTLDFIYDVNGRPYALIVNEATTYYYITNLQGDVINVVNSSGTTVASYEYDPYGNPVVEDETSLGFTNPLRYRGYYWNAETEMYYLQSRYYDPAIGRFINPDIVFDTDTGFQGYNLYAYCGNDPIGRIDIGGTDSVKSEDVDLADDMLDLFGGGGSGIFSSPSGQSTWKLFLQSLKDGLGGLNGEFRNSPSIDNLPQTCPNPNGRKGGAAHQNKIKEIEEDLIARGYDVKTEYRVDTTGGVKNTRYLDIYATKGTDSLGIQVGRQTQSGFPVARERYALDDIISSGFNAIFIPYN